MTDSSNKTEPHVFFGFFQLQTGTYSTHRWQPPKPGRIFFGFLAPHPVPPKTGTRPSSHGAAQDEGGFHSK